MKHLLYIFLIFNVACSNEVESTGQLEEGDIVITGKEYQELIKKDSVNKEPKGFDYDAIVYDDLNLPVVDSLSKIKMLMAGTFHNDEVFDGAQKEVWYGLFLENNSYYVKKVNIDIKQVRDEIVDEDDRKTGWEVTVNEPNKCIMLLTGIHLQERVLTTYTLDNNKILPGDTTHIDHLNEVSKLYATGISNKISEDFTEAFNYKLIYETEADGKQLSQILIAKKNFDDNFTNVIWMGYLDDDEKMDFIIDSSRHYNMMRPTLYLSSKAKKGNLVECVAMYTSVGC